MLPNGSIVGIKAAFENKEYRTYLEKTADGILNGKSSITVGELSKTSIFGDKQFRYIQALLGKQNIMTVATFDEGGVSNGLNQANGVMNDLTLSRNELIVLIMTTDAELVRTSDGKDFEFDGERTSAEYGGLKQMTKDDLKQIYELTKQHMPADIKNKNIDMSQKKPMGLNSYNENAKNKVGIMKTIRDEEYQAKIDSDVDKILNGNSSIKLSEFQKLPIFKNIQKQIEAKGRGTYLDIISKDEQLEEKGMIPAEDLEISRNELKTLLMVADANLVKIKEKESFEFDSNYATGEKSGFIEMTQDEIEQIYIIMNMRSVAGADAVNTFIENHS